MGLGLQFRDEQTFLRYLRLTLLERAKEKTLIKWKGTAEKWGKNVKNGFLRFAAVGNGKLEKGTRKRPFRDLLRY